MKGDPKIVELLNAVLTAELTAINQYYIHYKMCENWGYKRLSDHFKEESMEEMRHADAVIERILYLDGIPNMQRLNPVRVGETVPEQHQLNLGTEVENVKRLNDGIAACLGAGDNGTRQLLDAILKDEEEAIDWTEAQLGQIAEIGKERYLAEQMKS
jgi:bacterioferritin